MFEFEVYGTAVMSITGRKRADDRRRPVYMILFGDHPTLIVPGTSGAQRLTVFDCSGKNLYSKTLDVNQVRVVVDPVKFVPGVYIVTMGSNRKKMLTRRMIITH